MAFQFATRVDDSAPLISKGTLSYFCKRVTKKLKTIKVQTEDEIVKYNRLKIIRDEVRELKDKL